MTEDPTPSLSCKLRLRRTDLPARLAALPWRRWQFSTGPDRQAIRLRHPPGGSMPMSSAAAETTLDAAAGDKLARRNALILAVAQALAGGNNVVMIATGAIVGAMLAPDRSLATVPVSIYVVGMWMGALPRGWIARRYGRRTSLFAGTGFGALTGLAKCAPVATASFTLLCLGSLCTGFYAAVHQSYRFAAADTASDAFRPKAISWVMVGGIFAGLFGSQLVIATKDLWQPYLFAGTFIAQSAVALASAAVLAMVK